ncbi:MAG: diguanylate cyclase [Candidatus Mcinerneyibacterium aminivorans]|uniref:Diguanylate cyclase n=1 Tax=Candidatus Mcinerneyibacterium aminivorans TaxID=2703815 RepID=A0A5D0MGU0_9BACT|nr:MAG: diguanylate cyclase [Candidatus Mcinerneyibacterium aminivorans]
MKTLNERYEIEEKLGESDHSVVYKGYDNLKKRKVAVKFLKKTVKYETAKKLFKKEYIVNKSLSHPNIRKAFYYEKVKKIDGQKVSSEQYIQILDFVKKPFKEVNKKEKKENIKHFNQIINAMRFIYKNKKHHGDIKPNNILLDENNDIKLSDISPFFAIERKEIEDVKQLYSIFKLENFEIGKKLNSIKDFFKLDQFDPKQHINILYKHLKTSHIPVNLILSNQKIENILKSKKFINLYSQEEIKNAQIASRGLIPYFETENYYYVNITELDKKNKFNLIKILIKKIKRLETSSNILNKYKDKLSRLSNDLEDKKRSKDEKYRETMLEEASVNLIKEISHIYPVVIRINNYCNLDKNSKKIIQKFYDDIDTQHVKIICNSDRKLDEVFFDNFEAGILNTKRTERIFEYFFYHFPFNKKTMSEIFYYTNGEINLISNFLNRIQENKALKYKDKTITPIQKTANYLPFLETLSQVYKNLELREKYILDVIKLFNNKYSKNIFKNTSDEFQDLLIKLQEKGIILDKDKYYKIRHNYLLSLVKSDKNNNFYARQTELLKNYFTPSGTYIEIYRKIQFIRQNYSSAFSTIIDYYKNINKKGTNINTNKFFQIFLKFKERERELVKSDKFDLNWALYKLDQNNKLNTIKLIKNMEKTWTNKKQKFKYLANYITEKDKMDLEDIKEYYTYLENKENILNEKYNILPTSILSKLVDLGKYKKGLELYEKYFKPHKKDFNPKLEFNLNNILYNIYVDLQNMEKAEKISEKMIGYINQFPDKLSLNNKFQAFNKYAIILRRNQNFKKALSYYHKCHNLAQKLNNYDLLATVNVNLGVVYYYINEPEKMEKHMRKALESALKIKGYNIIFVTIGNLIEYYYSQYDFNSIENLIQLGEKYIDKLNSKPNRAYYFSFTIDYFLFFEKTKKVKNYLDKTKDYYTKENQKLSSSFVYYSQLIKYMHLTDQNWRKQYEEIINDSKIAATPRGKYLLISNLAMSFFEMGEFELAKEFLEKINKNYNKQFEEDEMINQLLLNLFFWYFDIKNINHHDFDLSKMKYLQIRFYFYFIYLKKSTDKDIYYYENYIKYILAMKKINKNTPKKYQSLQLNKFQKFNSLIKNIKSSKNLLNLNIGSLIKKYKKMGEQKINSVQQNFFKHAVYKKFIEKNEIIKNFINEVLAITQMKRGIFYEYSIENGWEKIKEIFDENFYEENEAIKNNIFDKIILAQKDGYKEWHAFKPKENGLTYAIAVPVIDINVSRKVDRSKFKNSSTPSSNIMNIKGVFYFDTKLNILKPQKKDINYLYYFREFTNISFYNLHLINSALKDNLTGLYTRENWISLTKSLLDHVKSRNKHLGILMVDIDDFKAINDHYGHKEGDNVLKKISSIFLENLRNMDTAGRYGGEEFIFSIITDNIKDIKQVSGRIRKKIEESNIIPGDNITISMGVSIYPKEGKFLEEIIEKADRALLYAKETGKNKAVLWENIKNKNPEESYLKQRVITDPARDKNKLNLIIQLIQSINTELSQKQFIKKINKSFYDNIGNISLLIAVKKENKIIVSDKTYRSKFNGKFSEKLDDNTHLIFKKHIEEKPLEIGIYIIEKDKYNDFDLNTSYYEFIGKLIIDKFLLYCTEIN